MNPIKQREKELLQSPNIITMITIFPDAMFKAWNYKTRKGKEFCEMIHSYLENVAKILDLAMGL